MKRIVAALALLGFVAGTAVGCGQSGERKAEKKPAPKVEEKKSEDKKLDEKKTEQGKGEKKE